MVCGRSSGVEHNLAKVRVGRSNRLARSICQFILEQFEIAALLARVLLLWIWSSASLDEGQSFPCPTFSNQIQNKLRHAV